VPRGVGFRGGAYEDLHDVQPFTTVVATEFAGSHPTFYSSVFYPIQPWLVNYFDYLANPQEGTIQLALTPLQYRSSGIPGGDDAATGVMRLHRRLDMRLFYSADTGPAAATAPPSIGHVAATSAGGALNFIIQASGSHPTADIQEVWVTYTALGGAWYGQWQSLDLNRNPADIDRWEGSLALPPGVSPADVRFMVQAASGSGLVTMVTNFGDYYTPDIDPADLALSGQPTDITLASTPASGAFGELASFSATLYDDGGAPLAERTLWFRMGNAALPGITNGNGQATVNFPLQQLPGSQILSVSFEGDLAYAASSTSRLFTLNKQPTSLSLAPAQLTYKEGEAFFVEATLADGSGAAIRNKSVLLTVRNSTDDAVFSRVLITDFQGKATLALNEAGLASGEYTIEAYFGGNSPLPQVPLSDAYYGPSSATGAVTVEPPPALGHVTGGGFFLANPDFCQLAPDCAPRPGKGHIAFVARHENGVIEGNLQFQLQVPGRGGGFTFSSEAYTSLTVTDDYSTAIIEGVGAIDGAHAPNGAPYAFSVWLEEGRPDRVAIRISWFDGDEEHVIFDTVETQPLRGGSIVIHRPS
jgi:hypothetical protein